MAQQSRGFTRPLKGKTGTIRWENKDVKDPGRIMVFFDRFGSIHFFYRIWKFSNGSGYFLFQYYFFVKVKFFFIKIICKNKISSEIFLLLLFHIIFYSRLNRELKKGKNWDRKCRRHRPLKVFLRGKKLVYRSLKRMIQIRIVENIWIPNTKLLICFRRSTGTGTFELISNFQYSRGGDVW